MIYAPVDEKPDLYRMIGDGEFRGAGFFYAEFAHGLTWVETFPPSYKGAYRYGDRLIVELLPEQEVFRVCACIGDGGHWRNPIPNYEATAQEYRLMPAQLMNLQPREAC